MRLFLYSFVLFVVSVLPACSSDRSGERAYWIAQYLSVSYPLKHIHVTSGYGSRKNPFSGEPSVHHGLDLRANYEEVMSMLDGVVVKTGSDDRSGNYVTLRYDGCTVSYCHLYSILCQQGDTLYAGEVVGISGNTGRSTAPHLHLTVKRDGNYMNPLLLLDYIKRVKEEALRRLGADSKLSVRNHAGRERFFEEYAPMAIKQQQRYGIPASVTLAQLAYESGWGGSSLAVRGNNYFGIKCPPGWVASGKPYSVHNDDKPNEKFCNYSSVEESFEHHSQLLMSERYRRCHRHSPTDYHAWLVGIKQCGYATNPRYVELCERLIKQYRLHRYDLMAET